MIDLKKFYVSIKYRTLDVGFEVESPNQFMAAVQTHIILMSDYGFNRDYLITDIEEVRNDQ